MGFLKDEESEKLTFVPIFDCGSCLFSTYTDEVMEECLHNNTKMQDCINNTSSAIKENRAKIKYLEYIVGLQNEECNKALLRIYKRINLKDIFNLIDEIPVISNIRKEFYKLVIKGKYENILTVAYKKLSKNNL